MNPKKIWEQRMTKYERGWLLLCTSFTAFVLAYDLITKGHI